MLDAYHTLAHLALREFVVVVVDTDLIGGTPSSPNKLRLRLTDGSFLDVWLSMDGDYAFHWERRRQHGTLYRWDNAPHHPHVRTAPDHFHDGDEQTVLDSDLSAEPETALRQILGFVRRRLE